MQFNDTLFLKSPLLVLPSTTDSVDKPNTMSGKAIPTSLAAAEVVDAPREYRESLRSKSANSSAESEFDTFEDIFYVEPEVAAANGVPSKNMLDIYVPKRVSGMAPRSTAASPTNAAWADASKVRLPVVIFVHGGGWKRFDRRSAVTGMHGNVGKAFAGQDYVAVVISYRLSFVHWQDLFTFYTALGTTLAVIVAACTLPSSNSSRAAYAIPLAFLCPLAWGFLHLLAEHSRGGRGCGRALSAQPVQHPTHCEDAASAVAWVIKNISKYGGDPTRMCLMGHSAGGHIVSMLATQPSFLAAKGVPDAFCNNIKALACLSGVYDASLLEDEGSAWYQWLGRAFRRTWFLRPAFGLDRTKWHKSFAAGVCEDSSHCASLQLPPVLLVNAGNDVGLELHTQKFALQLHSSGHAVRQVILQGCNHIDYVMGLGRTSWLGHHVTLPLLHTFFRTCLVDTACTPVNTAKAESPTYASSPFGGSSSNSGAGAMAEPSNIHLELKDPPHVPVTTP
jgi:acetyl esterase/lipase